MPAKISRDNGRVDNVARVYQELRSLIVSGQLPPGARVSERAVVARLGSSRTPVRSALHRLHQEGFVASASRGGDQRLIVTPLTQKDGRELFSSSAISRASALTRPRHFPRRVEDRSSRQLRQ